jgi:hypothetical protein
MRLRILSVLLLTIAAATTFSLIRGQERPASAARSEGTSSQTAAPAPSPLTCGSSHDFSKLGEFQKEMLVSCQRGAEWLYRVNGIKGRFLPGYVPALNLPMDDDRYLRQVGAAFALARAGRFLGPEHYAARATQAILTFLDDTVVDAGDVKCRHTSLPSPILNRLGAAALLVLAINELPAPQKDLLDKSEQLCNWIRRQARADGSLRCRDDGDDRAESDDADSVAEYPGLALYALLRSQKHRPADWKMELVRKAAGYYRAWWKNHRSLEFVPWQTAAYAEAFVQSKDAGFAQFVYEMNDWLCTLQYDHLEPRRLVWYGGFMRWADGKPVDAPPTIASALYAQSIADARRVTRASGDPARYQRYTEVLHRALQFVVRLQYTEANTQHFEEWYRRGLVGGFHASPRDGDLRLDYAQHALSALATYLEEANQFEEPQSN